MSIWLALGEVIPENGGLEFIRGSHRWNRQFQPFSAEADGQSYDEHPEKNLETEPTPDFDAQRDQHDIVWWPLQPGDAVAFHGANRAQRTQKHHLWPATEGVMRCAIPAVRSVTNCARQ